MFHLYTCVEAASSFPIFGGFQIDKIPFKKIKKMIRFDNPWSVFVSNGEVFICDSFNHCVRKVLLNGQVVTIAGHGNTNGYNGDGQLATEALLNKKSDGCCCFIIESSLHFRYQ